MYDRKYLYANEKKQAEPISGSHASAALLWTLSIYVITIYGPMYK